MRCVEVPAAISQGETRVDALKNIREAIELYLESFPGELELVEELDRVAGKKEVVDRRTKPEGTEPGGVEVCPVIGGEPVLELSYSMIRLVDGVGASSSGQLRIPRFEQGALR